MAANRDCAEMTPEEIKAELKRYIEFEARYGSEEATFDPETAQAAIDLINELEEAVRRAEAAAESMFHDMDR